MTGISTGHGAQSARAIGGYPIWTACCSVGSHLCLGGTACVGGSALHAPAPHDTTFMGPPIPDPEEDISGSPLRHGVRLATSHPPFIDGGRFGSPSSSSPGSSSVLLFWRPHGGSLFSSSPSPRHRGGSSSSSFHSPCHCGGSSFSSSPVGIMRAMAGSLHWPPILGGSASMAIPPPVTREVQDVSSWLVPNVGSNYH